MAEKRDDGVRPGRDSAGLEPAGSRDLGAATDPGAASDREEMAERVKQEVEQMGEGRKPIPPKRMPDLDDVADITSGGTPTGTGVSGNEVPPVELPQTASDDDLDEDEEVLA